MKEAKLSNSIISLNSRKSKNKANAKTSSTNVDSNSPKYESNSNSNLLNNNNYSNKNRNIKAKKNHINNLKNGQESKKKYINVPINELKQFKKWSSSNLNAIYQNILANDKENYLNIKPKFQNHFDITDIHRTILVDWLINVHLYFKLSDECLYLSIKLIDTFLARTINFTKNKLQLLGICSLQISSKYIEQIHPSINDLSDLCDKSYEKKEIIQFEKYLLQVNDYIIEQDQLLNYYDLLSLILKFNIKYYYFGKMLLDLTLMDIDFYKYQKNTIIFSICSIVIYNSKIIETMTDDYDLFIEECKFDKYKLKINDTFSNECLNDKNIYDNILINNINYLFSFYPSQDYSLVVECSKEIIIFYEKIKKSKYNSAMQKLFIQLKEIKEDYSFEQPNDTIYDEQKNSNCQNLTNLAKDRNEKDLNENIDMIIID